MGFFNKNLGLSIFISDGNKKMGAVPSVSLTPVASCHNCSECMKHCYARRMYGRYKSLRPQYDANFELYKTNPKSYFKQINKVLSVCDKFRFHVSGDIVDMQYMDMMVQVCRRNPKCEVLVFTKAYQIVNKYMSIVDNMPKNLHLIFSVWDKTSYTNPHNLPTAHVLYKDGHTTAKNPTHLCDGNCFSCFLNHGGCIGLKKGESVVFKEH